MSKYIKANVQGLPDKKRTIFVIEHEGDKPQDAGLWAEVFKIKDVMGKVFWTTDITREEEILCIGWAKYTLTELTVNLNDSEKQDI